MKITYDREVDALYIRFADGPLETEAIRLNDRVAINVGPDDQIVGIEVLDASAVLPGVADGKVQLENLVAA